MSLSPDCAADELWALVARLENLAETARVQGEILTAGPAAIPALERLLDEPPSVFPQPRIAAAECLGAFGGARAVAALVRAVERDHTKLADPVRAFAEETVRNAAARQLARYREPAAIAALSAALACHHLIGAGEALAVLGEATAIPPLIECLEDDAKRHAAIAALTRFGNAAMPALRRAIADRHQVMGAETPSSIIRRAAVIDLLRELGARDSVVELRAAQADRYETVSIAAALALAHISPEDAEAALLVIGLESADVVCQAECEHALSTLGVRGVPALRDAARRGRVRAPSLDVWHLHSRARRRAIALLREAAPSEFAGLIGEILHDADPAVRFQAVRGLKGLEHAERAAWLGAVARDPDPRVRAAAEALHVGVGRRGWFDLKRSARD